MLIAKQSATASAHSPRFDAVPRERQIRARDIVALASVMKFFGVAAPDINNLIKLGVSLGAYDLGKDGGWTHRGLAKIARHYHLGATPYDWSLQTSHSAFGKLEQEVRRGPCLTSIHKDINARHSGDLVVVTKITRWYVLYGEPVSRSHHVIKRRIGFKAFFRYWKRIGVIVKK